MKYFLTLTLILSSCATTKAIGTETKNIAVDCTKDSLKTAASQLVPAFFALLVADVTNWKEQAEALGKEFGSDVAICAARTALDKLTAPVQSEPTPEDPQAVKRTATARFRALEIETGVFAN